MDNFTSLWNRLLSRAPALGPMLAQQLINDSWRTLQARREWSWRRRGGVIAPPGLINSGAVSSNVANGNPLLITGTGTGWTPAVVGQQIRLGGLLFPYYTITSFLSPTSVLIDSSWAGPDQTNVSYQIVQIYYPMPEDFGYFYVMVSVKDNYKIYTELTEAELALLDPQRNQQGQSYGVAFKDFSSLLGGEIGPVLPITSPTDPAPISTTSLGFSYPANATYVIQVVTGGASGTATFQWLRAGQQAFQPAQLTSDQAQDLSDGVQIYWPDSVSYISGDLFVINCQSQATQGSARYELWPSPTFSTYLYPFIYIAKESDLSASAPSLPPPVASRGELILEMALEKAATFPGADASSPNPYYNLKQALYHGARAADMLIDFENNDQNVAIEAISYQNLGYGGPFSGPYGVWFDGGYQQSHAWGI